MVKKPTRSSFFKTGRLLWRSSERRWAVGLVNRAGPPPPPPLRWGPRSEGGGWRSGWAGGRCADDEALQPHEHNSLYCLTAAAPLTFTSLTVYLPGRRPHPQRPPAPSGPRPPAALSSPSSPRPPAAPSSPQPRVGVVERCPRC